MTADSECDTRERVLESAARLFAEQGIRGTTVKEICTAAGANVAAVNYYFGSKDRLVEEVWQSSCAIMQRVHGREDVEDLPPLARLESLLRCQLRAVMDDGPGGRFPKLVFRALGEFDHAEVEALFERHLAPRMRLLLETVRELLGPDAQEAELRACVLAVHSPCVHLNIGRNKGHDPIFRDRGFNRDPETIIDTIMAFVLGGIEATKRGLTSSSQNAEDQEV